MTYTKIRALTGRADRRDWQVALDRLLPRDLVPDRLHHPALAGA